MLFNLKKTYNFNTISTSVLDFSYKNLTVISYLGFDQAIKYSGIFNDVVTIREQLVVETSKPLLPAKDAIYVLFKDMYDNEILLAEDWIDSNSIQLVQDIVYNLTIKDITTSDTAIILDTLRALGYNNIEASIG